MGKVKSLRLNSRTERMFGIVKAFYKQQGNNNITDTEIISRGIEELYRVASVGLNSAFYDTMGELLKKYDDIVYSIFKKIYENLEVPCIMNGGIMQDEFWGFLVVNEELGSSYDFDSETGERISANMHLEKIYDIVSNQFDDKEKFEECIEIIYAEFFNRYGQDYS